MSDYRRVSEALSAGADPAMLCATCPWDRYCITPPTMTKGDVEKIMKEAEEKDRLQAVQAKAEGKKPQMPVGMLLTAVTMGGRDTQAACCPVFALRLRSGQGRTLVDQLKGRMTAWDDSQ